MRIAIDAMGGDHAPHEIVAGVLQAAKEWTDAELILVGDSARIEALMSERPGNVRVHHAGDVITADDEPGKAVRRKKDASMVVAGRLVREGEADAMISGGNTGALMVTGLLIVGRMEGVERPALAPMLPTMDGTGVLALDLGANMDASPEELLQYAIMGSIYRSKVQGIAKPRVGLLNIGTEAMKGNTLTKTAYGLLEQAPIQFVGNVEASQVMRGGCDVLVCDGFSGNVMLKAMEGTADAVFSTLKTEFTRTWMTKLAAAVMMPGLRQFKKKLDYKEHGGAPMLGLSGLVLKCHGSSDALAVKNAVRQARVALQSGLVQAIAAEINTRK
ncbi:MAG: phosphate acyltransferase [Paenibacillus sp.]|uniref:Phosphate acyltransferase n=1 Tax=Paenibacillus contaminans TaxID=450362 RepID=A0A329MK85_9BACL|nr:phosphate acyltransferase PlsX [Paenibacillus contaminans]MDF2719428.1 phosphate acyltransferase [Paenibacillus sp.]RAV19988.1 phosphate acyltransferase PlsX [Paenibacillus contaminans]